MKRIVALALLATALAPSAFAADATATAGAKIVTPLSMTSTSNLYFGTIAPSTTQADVAVVAPNGNFQCGAALSCLSKDQTAAAFQVTGYDQASYTVSLPSSIQISDGSGDAMTVSNFNADKMGGSLASGSDTFHVGGVLKVAASQPAGVYQGVFDVTANYQ